MVRLSPNGTLIFLACSSMFTLLVFILNNTDPVIIPTEYAKYPAMIYKFYFTALGFILLWWPIDMVLNWEKKTLAAETKDRWISAGAMTTILIVVPYFFLATPLLPTLVVALLAGFSIPVIDQFRMRVRIHESAIDPESVYQIAIESERAQQFMRYFPDSALFVTGLNAADGNRAHLLIHKRVPCDEAPDYMIDYVMDVGVDRDLGIYIGGKERLHCYLFCNEKEKARIGMLPSANIGRALDYGFTEEEVERAVEEANSPDQNFQPLDDKPLMVRYYSGKAVKL